MTDDPRFETRAIHTGQGADEATGATIVPVYLTATFTQDAIGTTRGYEYSRSGNPTRDALETALASLEGGRFGLGSFKALGGAYAVCRLLQREVAARGGAAARSATVTGPPSTSRYSVPSPARAKLLTMTCWVSANTRATPSLY